VGGAIEVNVGVNGAKSEIKVENKRGHESSAKDFSENVSKITVVGIVDIVIIGHHSARACTDMLHCNVPTLSKQVVSETSFLIWECLLIVNLRKRSRVTSFPGTKRCSGNPSRLAGIPMIFPVILGNQSEM